jgi:homeobox protein MSX
MLKSSGMTVTSLRVAAMTSPTAPTAQQKSNSRISNFSVASLLADTRPKTPTSTADIPANLSRTSSSPKSQLDKNDADLRSHTPHSSIESDDYDSNQEDSIVDIEDIQQQQQQGEKGSPLLPASALVGHVVRPTPFSALAAAAAAWGGMGGNVPWPGRQMPPFGPPGMFPGPGFGGGQLGGG